jgi:hypothetical protein
MQALMNVTRTSVTLATPHATHAAMGVAVAISAPGIRNLGTKGAAAAAVTLTKCNPRDAVVRAYSVAPDTGAHVTGFMHDQVTASQPQRFFSLSSYLFLSLGGPQQQPFSPHFVSPLWRFASTPRLVSVFQEHAKEDMYFRAEDVKQLNRLTKIARAQARAKNTDLDAAELSEVGLYKLNPLDP